MTIPNIVTKSPYISQYQTGKNCVVMGDKSDYHSAKSLKL